MRSDTSLPLATRNTVVSEDVVQYDLLFYELLWFIKHLHIYCIIPSLHLLLEIAIFIIILQMKTRGIYREGFGATLP